MARLERRPGRPQSRLDPASAGRLRGRPWGDGGASSNSPYLEPAVRRRALGPDPHGTSEEHTYYIGEQPDTRNLPQCSFDHADLVGGERLQGDDVEM